MLHAPQPSRRAIGSSGRGSRIVLVLALLATCVALLGPPASAMAGTTLFSDGFESGGFGAWSSVVTGGDGRAVVVTSPVYSGTHAARLSGTTNAGSLAYVRKTLGAAQASLAVSLALDVTAEGTAGSNVPILALYSWSGTRIVTLYRQNQTGGQVWLQDKSSYLKTSGLVPLGSWVRVTIQVAPTGTSSSTSVSVNGATVFSAPTDLGVDWPATLQLGSGVAGQAFTEYVDDVTIATGGSATASSSPPSPTPSSTGTGWKNVVNDQFASLASIPSHWTLYNGHYGSSPGNCAIPGHDTISGGLLHLWMYYQSSGSCGAGWYTGGMKLAASYGSIDQRVTLRFRVVDSGAAGHYILPMRWPTTASWPAGGEEDYCERDKMGSCTTFLHYSTSSTTQVYHAFNPDLSQWHTLRAQRRNHVVTIWLDDMSTPVWTYDGSSTTLPDTVKTVVLQQECLVGGCPSTTSGSEDIQIAWITVDNPS